MTQTVEASDPELAREFAARSCAEIRMSVHAGPGDVWLPHTRRDAGPFYHDVYATSMNVRFEAKPPGHLLVGRVVNGQFERDTDGTSERFGPGDVFLVSQPHRPYACRSRGVHLDLIGVGLAVVADVTGDPSIAVPGRLQLRGYQPVSPAAARSLTSIADFVTGQLLVSGETAASSLVIGSIARLLAATVLATFPNNAVIGPHPEEGQHAHTRTVRLAVAFIDAHVAEGISVADIAAAAFVTARAVQLAFRRHLDTTPLEYLYRARLERAHAELVAADPARTTVTAVAYRWGFSSPSRFAAAYRRAYGINPGSTLTATKQRPPSITWTRPRPSA